MDYYLRRTIDMAMELNRKTMEEGSGYESAVYILLKNTVLLDVTKRIETENEDGFFMEHITSGIATTERKYKELYDLVKPFYEEKFGDKTDGCSFKKAMDSVREDIDFDLGLAIAQDKWEKIFSNGLKAFEEGGK